MASAYLVITLDVTGVAPCVKDVGVYSTSGANLTTMSGEIRCDVYHTEAPSFSEAQICLIDTINKVGYYEWARPWVASGQDAFEGRDSLRNCLRVAASMLGARMS